MPSLSNSRNNFSPSSNVHKTNFRSKLSNCFYLGYALIDGINHIQITCIQKYTETQSIAY